MRLKGMRILLIFLSPIVDSKFGNGIFKTKDKYDR